MPTSTLHDLIDYSDGAMISETGTLKTKSSKTKSSETANTETANTDPRSPDPRSTDNSDREDPSQESVEEDNHEEVRQKIPEQKKKSRKGDYTCYKDPNNEDCQICHQWRDVISKKQSENRCSWHKLYTLSPKSADIFSLLIGFASATSFGGVHLFAWNSDFPTDVERLLWRISALMTIVLPYIYIGTHIPHVGSTVAEIRKQKKTLMNIFLGCIALCYIPCRLFLITESFRALYYLPSEAFKATPAVMSIPHLG